MNISKKKQTRINQQITAMCINENACLVHRILWKKNEVADYEATTFSIFYNNALFLALVIFSSFYILKTFSPAVYPLMHQQ
jgi:translocon-associated protein subunit gamma